MQEDINTTTDEWASMIEMDLPSKEAPVTETEVAKLDMLDVRAPKCVRCQREVTLDVEGVCESCFAASPEAAETHAHAADSGKAQRAVAQIKAHAAKVRVTQDAAKATADEALAQDTAVALAEASRPVEVAPTVDRREALYHGSVVAGAAAEGHGILTHWTGESALTVAQVAVIGARAGIAPEHLLKARKPETYAHAAVQDTARRLGLVAVKQKRDRLSADQAYDHRWRVHPLAQDGDAGQTAGRIAAVVTLSGTVLSFTTDGTTKAALAVEEVAEAYKNLSSAEVLTAGQVTSWLGGYLRDHLDAVKYGGCWYVPQETRAAAEQVISAFAGSGWGRDWMSPPTPIATSSQLARGVANGLASEVEELHKDQVHDTNATAEKKLGERGALGFLNRYKAKLARVKAFELVLGADLVAEVKATIEQKVKTLEGSLAACEDHLGISQRFAMVWEEVQFDARRAAEKAS